MYLSVPRRRLRGLRARLGDDLIPFGAGATGFVQTPANVAPQSSVWPINNDAPLSTRPASCSWYDYIWPTQACTTALAQQQIAEVPANAAAVSTYFAATQPNTPAASNAAAAAQVAQAMAAQQEALVPADTANIEAFYSSGGGVVPFSIPWWVWAALAGVGVWVIAK